MGAAAAQKKVALPADRAVDAEVDLGTADRGYLLRARLNVSLPGLDCEVAREIVDAAHQICPHSKATRGNIDIEINLVEAGSETPRPSSRDVPVIGRAVACRVTDRSS